MSQIVNHTECIVIGAGVVGLAIARSLAKQNLETVIVEQEETIASVTSARNSGIIHAAGAYYRPGSLKAEGCLKGRRLLYDYARSRSLPHRRCGKFIVATSQDEVALLEKMKALGAQNGVPELELWTAAQVQSREPEVFCVAALYSPESGILDVHSYAHSLLGDAEEDGAVLALQAPVQGGTCHSHHFEIQLGGKEPSTLTSRILINSAGLGAQGVSRQLKGLDPATIPPQVLAKGNYFSLQGKQPFQSLVYPVPVLGSLGLHACIDMNGRTRFGPDIEWVETIDYQVSTHRILDFETSIRHYWPALPKGALQPDYAGIRPKIAHASHYDTDFILQDHAVHGLNGLICLYGIESPGLTSSLFLADKVCALLGLH